MSENDIRLCSNCKHDVPVGNFEMHVIYCKRNIQLCPVCDEGVLRSEFENHNKELHSVMTCPECNIKFQSSELDSHKKNVCKKRIIACQYCNLELNADAIDEHEDYCGSRTECCNECGRHIMLKFQHLHLDSNHKFIKLNDDSPTDSDDEDLVMRTEQRHAVSPKRTTVQKHLRYPVDSSPPANKSSSSKSKHNGLKQRKSHHEDFSELSEYFKNMDLENGRITNATTSAINEILDRDRASSQENHYPWLEDETLIPCEFCKVPIFADNLVLHQTGCRPDLSSIQPSQSTGENPYQSYVRNLRREGVREINTDSDDDVQYISQVLGSDETIIPCEFCLQHFSLDDISSHQYLCRRNTSALQ
ncbi:TRAF-type zinc finger domain-containing protein 1-like [Planococcus citri]|uniref:TRAF-type zinc finger domain-containing protein 1-like n=1 Tax=Planococcus citri TaxID=170843 RepID=UPI0031F9C886